MTNPFTKPTISGYNAIPGTDTGAAGGIPNVVSWAKHIDNIGDPLKNFAQAIADNIEDAFKNIFGTGNVDMLFVMASAPTGWIQNTTDTNRFLRMVNTAGQVVGGQNAITGLTVGDTTLTLAQIPAHGHPYRHINASEGTFSSNPTGGLASGAAGGSVVTRSAYSGTVSSTAGEQIGGSGGGGAHTHSISSDGNWRPRYIDVIRCSRSFA